MGWSARSVIDGDVHVHVLVRVTLPTQCVHTYTPRPKLSDPSNFGGARRGPFFAIIQLRSTVHPQKAQIDAQNFAFSALPPRSSDLSRKKLISRRHQPISEIWLNLHLRHRRRRRATSTKQTTSQQALLNLRRVNLTKRLELQTRRRRTMARSLSVDSASS